MNLAFWSNYGCVCFIISRFVLKIQRIIYFKLVDSCERTNKSSSPTPPSSSSYYTTILQIEIVMKWSDTQT